MRKIIEAFESKSKTVYDLETCVKKNLEKMFHKIPRYEVKDLSNRYLIDIYCDDYDAKTLASANAIKKWVKEWGIEFSKLKSGKIKDNYSTNFWCEVYK